MSDKPPLPTVQPIADPLLEQWVKIPSSEQLKLNITRNDVDQLFFAINNIIQSQGALQEALIAYSNGNLPGANDQMDLSKRWSIESTNALRSFLTSVISGELKNRAGNSK